MTFVECTVVLHINQLWCKSNVMFLECTVVLTCLYQQLPITVVLVICVMCQPGVEC